MTSPVGKQAFQPARCQLCFKHKPLYQDVKKKNFGHGDWSYYLFCKKCISHRNYRAEDSWEAEGDSEDLLKWVEDYLWDNDKKGYQAYYEHRKSLGLSAENNAYTYAYNEGHSDARKTGKYHPTLVADRDKADFKRVLKQKE